MRDVRHEVALRAFDLLDASDIVQHGDSTAAGHRRDSHLKDAARHQGGRTAFADSSLLERGTDAVEHAWIANGLDQRMSNAHTAAKRGVRQESLHSLIAPLNAARGVDRNNGVLH